jgi:signal transduction histidine kinase
MKSLFSKILVWSFGTLVLSFIAFVAISFSISTRVFEEQDLLGSLTRMQAYGALDAYRQGGALRLQSYLALLNQYLQLRAEYHLVDDRGRDLLTGDELNALLAEGRPSQRLLSPFRSRLVIATPLPDRSFTFILVTQPPVRLKDFLPYYLLIVLVVGVLCYLLSAHLVTPLKELGRTVERFGGGDLASRFQSQRKDEIGALGRAFDDMAGRIQSLLQAQSQLLQDVSHELRSPLARMSFAIELIKTPETREQALVQVRQELDRLTSLIDALLQVSRGESDASQLNLCEIALGGLLQEIVGRCAIEADARHCRIAVTGADAVIIGDRAVLDRAIENVLRNAIHHSPADSVVEVDLRSNDGAAAISIRDHGPGVPAESLDRIFKPFYRLDPPHAGGGVGLGLSITQRAIALHNGRIQATNASPGLRVTIELKHIGTGP